MYSIWSEGKNGSLDFRELNCDGFAQAEGTFCRLVKTGCSLWLVCEDDGETVVMANKGKITFTHPNIMRYKNSHIKKVEE